MPVNWLRKKSIPAIPMPLKWSWYESFMKNSSLIWRFDPPQEWFGQDNLRHLFGSFGTLLLFPRRTMWQKGSRYYKYLDAEQLHRTRPICWAAFEIIVLTFFWESLQVLAGCQSSGLETIEERQQLLPTYLKGITRLMMIYWRYDENSSCFGVQQGSKRWHQQIECKWPLEASQYGDSLTKNNATAMTTG